MKLAEKGSLDKPIVAYRLQTAPTTTAAEQEAVEEQEKEIAGYMAKIARAVHYIHEGKTVATIVDWCTIASEKPISMNSRKGHRGDVGPAHSNLIEAQLTFKAEREPARPAAHTTKHQEVLSALFFSHS